jgi:hypothetical protein
MNPHEPRFAAFPSFLTTRQILRWSCALWKGLGVEFFAPEKKIATRQSAFCTTSRPHKCMRIGLNGVAKLVSLNCYPQGTLGSRLVSVRVVWSKLFGFSMQKVQLPVCCGAQLRDPSSKCELAQTHPRLADFTSSPTGQLAILIRLRLDWFSLSFWSFWDEKLGSCQLSAACECPWRTFQVHGIHSLCSL